MIAIYNENIFQDCYGGAEVYTIFLAKALASNEDVVVFGSKHKNTEQNINRIVDEYKLRDKSIQLRSCPKLTNDMKFRPLHELVLHFWFKRKLGKKFRIFINCTYNMIPGMKNMKSIRLIHFPALPLNGYMCTKLIGDYFNLFYKKDYDLFITNSQFTSKWLMEYWQIPSKVLYPPIAKKVINEAKIKNKENIILTVGRISPEKKLIYLVRAFKRIKSKGWKFVIIGNVGDYEYLEELMEEIDDKSIRIICDAREEVLNYYYAKSKIYWHAMGYHETQPIRMEHFGMTTVEAMCHGCVPIVYDAGGQHEIVGLKFGFRWKHMSDLISDTLYIISHESKFNQLAQCAVDNSKKYLLPNFNRRCKEIVIPDSE